MCNQLVFIFNFDPVQIGSKNKYRSLNSLQFMLESLTELSEEVKRLGGHLLLYEGDQKNLIQILTGRVELVFIATDTTPFAQKRQEILTTGLGKSGITVTGVADSTIFPLTTLKTSSGGLFRTFTPYYRKMIHLLQHDKTWEPQTSKRLSSILPASEPLRKTFPASRNLKDFMTFPFNDQIAVHGGRQVGLKILKRIRDFKDYLQTRDYIAEPTTLLGAHIKFGTVSIREVVSSIVNQFGYHHELLRQVIWHDFFALVYFQQIPPRREPTWEDKRSSFKAWCLAKTGFPLIDAGITQLVTTGWMHNRVRMATANFLTMLLRVDWRLGERFFAQHLVDYDPSSNNGNWQVQANVGTVRTSYLQIFSPKAQLIKYDPTCLYVKRYLPVFADVPAEDIINWEDAYVRYPGIHYPPIISYAEARAASKTWFR